MCGICFVLNGVDISNNVCNFNIYEPYARNPFLEGNEKLKTKYLESKLDFIHHLSSQGLIIGEFGQHEIEKAIGMRGPNAFAFSKVVLKKEIPNKKVDNANNTEESKEESQQNEIQEDEKQLNLDSKEIEKEATEKDDEVEMMFWSSLLHLRGKEDFLRIQPIEDAKQTSTLIYNGEIFESRASSNNFNPFKSDTEQIYLLLNKIVNNFLTTSEDVRIDTTIEEAIAKELRSLQGDYSFVYFNEQLKKLFIAKDPFGKRSLLLGMKKNGFVVSSCAIDHKGAESKLKAEDILETDDADEEMDLKDEEERKKFLENKYAADYQLAIKREWIEVPANMIISVDLSNPTQVVWEAVEIEKRNPECTYQFDSTTKAIEIASDIDLKIVCDSLRESVKIHIQNIFAFQDYFREQEYLVEGKIHNKIESDELTDQEKILKDFRTPNTLRKCHQFTYSLNQTDSSIAVLFSGGLDSALITLLLDQLIPPGHSIDLINLSFKAESSDRSTALKALEELQAINSNRKYNLILIDKSMDDLSKNEGELLKLIYPRNTHMDFNIALVLNLASKATGYLHTDKLKQEITSGSKVILSGLGADEIFGGYSRYRVAFLRNGYKDLVQEMKFDLERLWIRNLGRDDRAISQNGREVRFPFLNKKLIETVSQKIDFGCFTNFGIPKGSGIGDKILLRQVAKRLGLLITSGFRKKAIQFGTGIAKQSNIRTFGSNRKGKGSSKYGMKETK